ncbi:MAG: hypothetical protein IKK83_07135 [Clostridia bacterium]|nr:hypothetical protein [Clostridia bacterium]MBR6594942.1 hypothetical protein [Clostridia bacterium]
MKRIACVLLSLLALAWGAPTAAAEETVYIKTAADLAALSARVAAGDSMEGTAVFLENDISLSGEHTPIGTDPSRPFSGSFDGKGHIISGLSVSGGGDYSGLFGCVTHGSVRNLSLEGATVEGGNYSALLVGRLYAYQGTAAVEDCFVSGSINGTSYTGGVVGLALSASFGKNAHVSVKDCTARVRVKGDLYVGGIFGNAESRASVAHSRTVAEGCTVYGTVRASGNYGAIGGGVGGALSAKCDSGSALSACNDCLSYGDVNVEKTAAGGVLGTVGAVGAGAVATMEGCIALGSTGGGAMSGGLCGKCESAEEGIASLKDSVAAGNVYGGSVFSLAAGQGIENCVRASSASDLPAGILVAQSAMGDVNADGKVNALDAALILRSDAALGIFGVAALAVADPSGDGRISSLDAALVLRYDAGLIKGF